MNRFIARKMSTKFNDYFNEVGYYGHSAVTSLIPGAPGTKMRSKCADILLKASQHRLEKEKENGYLFQYGATRGDWSFVENLSKFLTTNYNRQVSVKNLFTTSGASYGLYMVASLYFRKGDTVFVEDPTYFLASNILKDDLGLNVVPVGFDSDGIDVSVLEDNVKKYVQFDGVNRDFSSMVYVIPAHHNPTGLSYSVERCKQLVTIARKYNLLVFCDDVYNLLSYKCESKTPLLYYDSQCDDDYKGNVISNSTFSKLLGPGLRLGWIQASEKIINKFRNSGLIKSGGCPNNYTSGIIASVMELGLLDDMLGDLLTDYRARLVKVSQILRENLPKSCSFVEPQGGFFIWITLPTFIDVEQLLKRAKEEYKVSVLPGYRCSVAGNFRNCIRISYIYQDEGEVYESVTRFCSALNEFC